MVNRKFRGAEYNIGVSNSNRVSKGVKRFVVDGKELKGNTLSVFPAGSKHKVEATLG